MTIDPWNLAAIIGMMLATMACRFGGYLAFRHVRPGPVLDRLIGYIPGTLFVSFVAPALLQGGALQWAGGAATVAVMIATRNLGVSIIVGTAAAWVFWQLT